MKCNNFGHISKHCSQKVENSNVRSLVSDCMMNKVVTVNNQNYNALFDTGSKYNIMSEGVFGSMQKPKQKSSNFYLIGFGKKNHESKIKPIGHLEVNIEIEAERYCLVFHPTLSTWA